MSASQNAEPAAMRTTDGTRAIPHAFHPVAGLTSNFAFNIQAAPDSITDAVVFYGFGDAYAEDSVSVFCFRGGHRRDRPSRGFASGRPRDVRLAWRFDTAYDTTGNRERWGGGAGWTGQPLLIHWNRRQKVQLGITDTAFLADDRAMELIIGSLSGNVYFLDAATGLPTRAHMSIGNPIKGTVSVDPRKNGLLYVGQGIPETERFGAYVLDMFTRREVLHIDGDDPFSPRRWGAFDSNPLIDAQTGTVFWPSENGVAYRFVIDSDKYVRNMTRMRYQRDGQFKQGMESSLAVIGDMGFVADNSGTVLCMNLRTMAPVWNADNTDDTDATTVVDEEAPGVYRLYTGCEVDHAGATGEAHFRKLDAATGREIWRVSRTCQGDALGGRTNSGGILATPLVGKHRGDRLVYCIFSRIDERGRGLFVAVDKHTGREVFSIQMDHYSWSSPADFYDRDGNIYIFFSDVYGTVYVVDGLTGEMLVKRKTGYVFESSPIVFNDRVYIASRGKAILSFSLLAEGGRRDAVEVHAGGRDVDAFRSRIRTGPDLQGGPQRRRVPVPPVPARKSS